MVTEAHGSGPEAVARSTGAEGMVPEAGAGTARARWFSINAIGDIKNGNNTRNIRQPCRVERT
ncbi:MAG: hypothetical protein ACREUR_03985, partial [Nitrosospira sp.]